MFVGCLDFKRSNKTHNKSVWLCEGRRNLLVSVLVLFFKLLLFSVSSKQRGGCSKSRPSVSSVGVVCAKFVRKKEEFPGKKIPSSCCLKIQRSLQSCHFPTIFRRHFKQLPVSNQSGKKTTSLQTRGSKNWPPL